MGVAVLNPQDCLKDPFSRQNLIPPHMKCPRNPNPNPNRSNRTQANRRRRSPSRSLPNSPPSNPMVIPKLPTKNLVMGQVKILKRGQDLKETVPAREPVFLKAEMLEVPDLGSTERLGPEPELVPVHIRISDSKGNSPNFYAGSAFFTSPPPSSVPLPAFFVKKCVSVSKTDDATSDLRRMLRLD